MRQNDARTGGGWHRRPETGARPALPSTGPLKTIAAWKAYFWRWRKQGGDPRFVEMNERLYDGLRKAGLPEE